jgi:hypothetical protein
MQTADVQTDTHSTHLGQLWQTTIILYQVKTTGAIDPRIQGDPNSLEVNKSVKQLFASSAPCSRSPAGRNHGKVEQARSGPNDALV